MSVPNKLIRLDGTVPDEINMFEKPESDVKLLANFAGVPFPDNFSDLNSDQKRFFFDQLRNMMYVTQPHPGGRGLKIDHYNQLLLDKLYPYYDGLKMVADPPGYGFSRDLVEFPADNFGYAEADRFRNLMIPALREKNAITQLKRWNPTQSGEDLPEEVLQMIGDKMYSKKGPHISLVPIPNDKKLKIVYSKGRGGGKKKKRLSTKKRSSRRK